MANYTDTAGLEKKLDEKADQLEVSMFHKDQKVLKQIKEQ